MAMKSPSASTSPATYARPRPSWLGIHSSRRMASGELTRNVPGAPPPPRASLSLSITLPSQNSIRTGDLRPEQHPHQRRQRFGDGPRLDVCSHPTVVAHLRACRRATGVTARRSSGVPAHSRGGVGTPQNELGRIDVMAAGVGVGDPLDEYRCCSPCHLPHRVVDRGELEGRPGSHVEIVEANDSEIAGNGRLRVRSPG